MMQRLQTELGVDASPHRIGRADQESHLSGADVGEQALLGLRLPEVLHERDFRRRDARVG